jgi:hypothetical protein
LRNAVMYGMPRRAGCRRSRSHTASRSAACCRRP